MLRLLALSLAVLLSAPPPARAGPVKVAASIPPVAALVQMITGEQNPPDILLSRSASPHQSSLRPSQLRTIRSAALLVQIGANLEPWLDRLETPDGVRRIVLSQVPGTVLLKIRSSGRFTGNAGHRLGDEAAHRAGPGFIDPHMWFDPQNLSLWLGAVTEALSELDPDNREIYAVRRDSAVREFASLEAEISVRMKVLDGTTIILAHDAFQYFDHRFRLQTSGALRGADDLAPGAASVAGLARFAGDPSLCVIRDASRSGRMARAIFPEANHVTIDPLGWDIPLGEGWLTAFFEGLAAALESCLG